MTERLEFGRGIRSPDSNLIFRANQAEPDVFGRLVLPGSGRGAGAGNRFGSWGQNEDGSYSWKFDNYVHNHSPYEFNIEDARDIWNQIRCPVLLVRGEESWTDDPEEDGRASAFHDYRSVTIPDAGHWVHHDQLEPFLAAVRPFLLSEAT